jgi:DNA-binding XRE family transcriptional regulator
LNRYRRFLGVQTEGYCKNKRNPRRNRPRLFHKILIRFLPDSGANLNFQPEKSSGKIKGYTICYPQRLPGYVADVPKKLPHQKLIGDAIRIHRKACKMSQEKLAEKADLHPVYLGQVERGEQTVSVHALMRIANALGVRVRDLVKNL